MYAGAFQAMDFAQHDVGGHSKLNTMTMGQLTADVGVRVEFALGSEASGIWTRIKL